jgi:hypothetical protein
MTSEEVLEGIQNSLTGQTSFCPTDRMYRKCLSRASCKQGNNYTITDLIGAIPLCYNNIVIFYYRLITQHIYQELESISKFWQHVSTVKSHHQDKKEQSLFFFVADKYVVFLDGNKISLYTITGQFMCIIPTSIYSGPVSL